MYWRLPLDLPLHQTSIQDNYYSIVYSIVRREWLILRSQLFWFGSSKGDFCLFPPPPLLTIFSSLLFYPLSFLRLLTWEHRERNRCVKVAPGEGK
jgi:hypothetical protein